MLDDFVEKIGEEHVVQVVTDNAANYKAAGTMLMDKRKMVVMVDVGERRKMMVLVVYETPIIFFFKYINNYVKKLIFNFF